MTQTPHHTPFLCCLVFVYSMTTTAPSSFIVATIFSASSFGTDSFMSLGALSTNFLESTKLRPSKFLTSLMTLGLDPASNDCSLMVKSVFSAAAGAASSSSTGAAAGAAGPAAKPPTGRSGMLRRVCRIEGRGLCQYNRGQASFQLVCCWMDAAGVRTFKLETRSAVSSRVNWLIWSTMAEILGLAAAAAASVELYLRVMRCCWRRELDARIGAALLARSWRAQHWAAYLQDSDMAGEAGGIRRRGKRIGRLGRRACGLASRWGAVLLVSRIPETGFFRPSFEKSTGARLIGWPGRPGGWQLEQHKCHPGLGCCLTRGSPAGSGPLSPCCNPPMQALAMPHLEFLSEEKKVEMGKRTSSCKLQLVHN